MWTTHVLWWKIMCSACFWGHKNTWMRAQGCLNICLQWCLSPCNNFVLKTEKGVGQPSIDRERKQPTAEPSAQQFARWPRNRKHQLWRGDYCTPDLATRTHKVFFLKWLAVLLDNMGAIDLHCLKTLTTTAIPLGCSRPLRYSWWRKAES